jgi:hypothetical protein
MLTLIAAFALQVSTPAPAPAHLDQPRRGSRALLDSLEAAELRFFYEWGEAFRLTQLRLEGLTPDTAAWRTARLVFLHCRYKAEPRLDSAAIAEWRAIKSAGSNYAVCPSWQFADSLRYDERTGVDAALDDRFRAGVRQARASIITLLEAAQRTLPTNEWIVGQRVRLLVDQRDVDGAMSAARSCQARRAWCEQLIGYVLTLRGDVVAAESAFEGAQSAMPVSERCAWRDVGVLLDPEDRPAYTALSCGQRDSVANVLWWLADPLYIDTGNERRTEQFARQVAIALRSALNRDERWDWRVEAGGDALREMVARYGWPSYTAWGGVPNDRAHSGYLLAFRGNINPPYTTFEYALNRIQTFPVWSALANPYTSKSTDWTLSAKEIPRARPVDESVLDPRNDAERKLLTNTWWGGSKQHPALLRGGAPYSFEERDVIHEIARWWWPQQHYAARAPLVQLQGGVTAFLRRQDSAVFATAADLDTVALNRSSTDTVDASLIVSDRPDSVRRVMHSRGPAGAPFVLFGVISARPAVAGFELPPERTPVRPGGRTRFGITPPPPLSAMKSGEHAISDLVLLRAPLNGADFPTDPDHILPYMSTSLRVEKTARLGVYWETYGFTPGDSAEIAVWVERYTPQGVFRQFGIALNIAKDLNTPVSVSWTEVGPNARAYVIPGPVPVIGRSVVLDVSKLAPGNYWLDVVVRKPGKEPVKVRRSFVVVAQ